MWKSDPGEHRHFGGGGREETVQEQTERRSTEESQRVCNGLAATSSVKYRQAFSGRIISGVIYLTRESVLCLHFL